MTEDRPSRRRRTQEPTEIEPDVEELLGEDGLVDDARHYRKDPDHLADGARDEDEQEAADVLEVDQTELEELGLVLDDPHQPEDG